MIVSASACNHVREIEAFRKKRIAESSMTSIHTDQFKIYTDQFKIYNTVSVLKCHTQQFLIALHMQTVQIQIRLLLGAV